MNIRVFDICWDHDRKDLPKVHEVVLSPDVRKYPTCTGYLRYRIGAELAGLFQAIPIEYKYVIGNSAKVWRYRIDEI